jgi:hypothetical protein
MWPLVGPETSRWVLMLPLLERYGIPFQVESADAGLADEPSPEEVELR